MSLYFKDNYNGGVFTSDYPTGVTIANVLPDVEDGDAIIMWQVGDDIMTPHADNPMRLVFNNGKVACWWAIKGNDYFSDNMRLNPGGNVRARVLGLEGHIDDTCYVEYELLFHPDGDQSFNRFLAPDITGLPTRRARYNFSGATQTLATEDFTDFSDLGGEMSGALVENISPGICNMGTVLGGSDNAAQSPTLIGGRYTAGAGTQEAWSCWVATMSFIGAEPKPTGVNSPVMTF